ncbi:MAG TPA: DNA repair protein RadC [Polyangia bacterium]|nr:DNA repair protein RadC [Polyangia bacterium]
MTNNDPTLSLGSDALERNYRPQSCPPPTKLRRVAGAAEVYALLSHLGAKDREHLVVLLLNVRHQVIRRRTIAIGSLTGVEVHPREVFKPAILASAAAIILAHNHPSGDATPSRADIELTTRLRSVGDLVGIPVLDHLVICREGYVSLAERAWR